MQRSTRHSLIMSALSLLLCASMLIGTTFAWFTDSVTSTGNIIKSGTLDVSLEWMEGKQDPADKDSAEWTDASEGAIFNYSNWEPGFTQVKHIKIENEGTLALKYKVNIVPTGTVEYPDGVNLADVIDVYYLDPAQQMDDRAELPASARLGTLTEMLAGLTTSGTGTLKTQGEAVTVTLALKMQESAGNEYQNRSFGTEFAVQLLATQVEEENDSFDNKYDIDATFPIVVNETVDGTADETLYAKDNGGDTLVAVTVPAGAPAGDYELNISEPIETEKNGETSISLNITLLKDGVEVDAPADVVYPVTVNVGPSLLISKVLHNSEEITVYSYDSVTGLLTFETDSFSPFEVIYVEVPADAAAKIVGANGKISFANSIGTALANAADGDVISAMADAVLTETAVFGNDVSATLDLAGYTVSGEIETLLKLTDGSLTIKNGSFKNVHEAATETKYSIYMAGDAVAEIKDVNIETTGVGIYMTENAKITELDANVSSYITVSGNCTFDAISMLGNSRIDLISDGTYKTYFAESMFEAKLAGKTMSYNQCYTVNLNSEGTYIGEIRGGTFIGAMDTANNGTPIHVNNGTVELISGGYFGFAEKSFSDPIYILFANTSNGGKINKITGGTYEKGTKPVDIPKFTGYGCDFENIVAASGCKVELTGETVVRGNQLSTKVKETTLDVVRVVAK